MTDMKRHYQKRPRVGDCVETGRYGLVEVLRVHQDGLRLTVEDDLGRVWMIERAPSGWWCR